MAIIRVDPKDQYKDYEYIYFVARFQFTLERNIKEYDYKVVQIPSYIDVLDACTMMYLYFPDSFVALQGHYAANVYTHEIDALNYKNLHKDIEYSFPRHRYQHLLGYDTFLPLEAVSIDDDFIRFKDNEIVKALYDGFKLYSFPERRKEIEENKGEATI